MGTTKNSEIVLKIVTACLVIVFVVSGVLLGLEIWDKNRGKFDEKQQYDETIIYNGREYVLKSDVETFLVMGLDKASGTASSDSYNNDKQADFLMLLVFDNATKKCSSIHINRDTMAEVDILGVAGEKIDTVKKQIALAHTYGNGKNVSCQNTADAVSRLLNDVKVNHYISLALDSVAIFNDLVGGVEVTVLDDFTGIDDTLIKGEKITLKGKQALNYVRERYGLEDSTNATRMKRQKQYLEALYAKTQEKMNSDNEFAIKATAQMADYIISDRSATQLQEIGKKLNEYEFSGILDIEGESKKGEKFMEFYPKSASIDKLVFDLFYELKK